MILLRRSVQACGRHCGVVASPGLMCTSRPLMVWPVVTASVEFQYVPAPICVDDGKFRHTLRLFWLVFDSYDLPIYSCTQISRNSAKQ